MPPTGTATAARCGLRSAAACHARRRPRAEAQAHAGVRWQRSLSAVALGRHRRDTRCAVWQRVNDAASGRDYFWNPATGVTAWELPEEATTAAAVPAPDDGLSNAELETLFMDYILTPEAKFDYPSPSAAFMDLVETHRVAIYERADNFFAFLNAAIDVTPPGGPPVTRSAGAPALVAEAARRQSTAAAGIAMFADDNMRWNTEVVLTRLAALESIRARLSNPGLRDANPAF